eukprot:scaffold2723_cov108-Isochrysis_galbana.AAC.13
MSKSAAGMKKRAALPCSSSSTLTCGGAAAPACQAGPGCGVACQDGAEPGWNVAEPVPCGVRSSPGTAPIGPPYQDEPPGGGAHPLAPPHPCRLHRPGAAGMPRSRRRPGRAGTCSGACPDTSPRQAAPQGTAGHAAALEARQRQQHPPPRLPRPSGAAA